MASPPTTVIQMASQANGEPARSPSSSTVVAVPQSKTIPGAGAPSPDTTSDKVMSSVANLAQLLPTGTVMAYQALSPTFTNHGSCVAANKWLAAVLVGVLAVPSLFFSFTDSIIGRDRKLYYGVATVHGFNVFNFSADEEQREWVLGELQRLRLRPLDYVHAVFTAVVFLTMAFSDEGLQRCFFPDAGVNTNELLKNLPLGMAFLSSFVFLIFPTKRKGIGYNDTTPSQNNLLS
ncbi:hypothetical protein U9M48_019705 [Paspalum notatum var. saurae]|uniref:Uncharacterized protein n=1 Tax=Paspalum notatum var. saurae TaxID=547442 RepID=A0AAQ3WRG8_PASNO